VVKEKMDSRERRRSERWQCAKEIHWRIYGGRRVRHGLVPERSMDGMVIATSKEDVAPEGTRVFPSDHQSALRHGFHAGVVCRTTELDQETELLFIEILA
jgi:hypothetical protein